jgi:hypothetical protein
MGIAFSIRGRSNPPRIIHTKILRQLAICLLVAIATGPAAANTFTWTNASITDSNWSNGGNWTPAGGPPTVTDFAIVTPGLLGTNGPAIVNAGTASSASTQVQHVSGVDGEIQLVAGTTLSINGGDLTNDGLIVVNSNGGTTATRILFAAFMGDFQNTLSGTGTIQLQAGPQTFSSAPASIQTSGSIVTQEADHTIRGVGLVSATIVNNGSIIADNLDPLPGDNRLEISGGSMTNNGLLSAESGATLDIVGPYTVTQGSSGVIQALNGGTVRLREFAVVQNGTLQTKGTGLIVNTTGTFAPRLVDVTNEGTYRINSSATTFVSGNGLTNNGEIQAFGTLNYLKDGVLGGTGSLVLGVAGILTGQTLPGPPVVITQEAGHSIRGQGQVQAPVINNGTIRAEGGTMRLTSQEKTNNYEIRASSGSTLQVESSITQNSSTGLIIAEDGSTVKLMSTGKVTNGRLQTLGSGIIQAGDNTRLSDVHNQGTIHVRPTPSVGNLAIEGSSLTNDGEITVNPLSQGGSFQISFCCDPQMTLDGAGFIDLNTTNATLLVAGGTVLTNAASHTINGPGAIDGSLVNQGTVTGGTIAGPVDIIRVLGRLSGTGNLKDIRFNGTHAPGLNGAGSVSVDGQYEIASTGKLEIEIGGTTSGTDYDAVNVNGFALLGGTIDVKLINSFQPQPGQTFPFLTTTTGVNNTFTHENLPALYGGLYFDVQYSASQVDLAVEGILGDYNHSGAVDAADYVVWRKSIGQSGSGLAADGNHNNQIDSGDYDVWRAHFGQIAGSGSGAVVNAAVPEPASTFLLIMASMAVCLVCRRAV